VTVLLEYMTALLEYLGFCYKAYISPKVAGLSPLLILSILSIKFNYLGFKSFYSTAKLTPYLHGLLI